MRRSRLSSYKQAKLIEHFVAGTTARTAASLVGVNKTTAAYYFHRLRELICAAIDDETPFHGEVEGNYGVRVKCQSNPIFVGAFCRPVMGEGPLHNQQFSTALFKAALASSRVESSVGNGEFSSLIISGISVHPSTTASQPADFMRVMTVWI